MLSLPAFAALAIKSLRHAAKPAGVVAVPVAAAVAVVLVAPHTIREPSATPDRDRPTVAAEQAPEPTSATPTLPAKSTAAGAPLAAGKQGPAAAAQRAGVSHVSPRQALVNVSIGNQTVIIEPTQGRPDRGPVQNALACAQHLTITPYVIGCP